jgi:ABC-type multidrug transport system ATPase subunit
MSVGDCCVIKNLTGADEAVTFDLVTSMRIIARVRQISVVGSILQPSSEVFQLFDRVIVLDGGQIMFQGPREDALPYFESLGYVEKEEEEEEGTCVHTYLPTYIHREKSLVLFSGDIVTCHCFAE